MSRRILSGVVAALAFASASTCVRAQTLGIGDPAPKIEVKSFVKGEAVKSFEPGKIYVVEFWATWADLDGFGASSLTRLQKKYPEVVFIGVSVFEQDPSGVEPFVKKMGDKMAYRVALDAVPTGKDPGDGAMAKAWVDASGRNELPTKFKIPTEFIINKEGKIAWFGYPTEMAEPLKQVIDGTWDLKVAAKDFRKKKQELKLQTKLMSAQRSGDPKKIIDTVDEIIAERPDLEFVAREKLQPLINLEEQGKALALAKTLAKSEWGKSAEAMNFIAWAIVDPDLTAKPGAALVKLALELAKKADDRKDQKDGQIADTLAKAYFDSGDATKALKTQERAVRLMKENGETITHPVEDRLEQYKKAVEEK